MSKLSYHIKTRIPLISLGDIARIYVCKDGTLIFQRVSDTVDMDLVLDTCKDALRQCSIGAEDWTAMACEKHVDEDRENISTRV